MQVFSSSVPLFDATSGLNHWIEVDIDALESNLKALQAAVGASEVIPVVKANAYGHGIAGVSRVLEAAGVYRVAVAWLSEAILLRGSGFRGRMVVLEHVFPSQAEDVVRHDVAVTAHSRAVVDALSAAAEALGSPAAVHIKVDSGLHRFGLSVAEAVSLAEYARAAPGVTVQGVWTHMANADEVDDSFSDEQEAVFHSALRQLSWIPLVHAANSATLLRREGLRFNAVRSGVAMYGILPENTPDPGLAPVLSLKARVARVSVVEAGEGVSYGLAWRAAVDSQVALVPVGYADGWRRSLGNRGSVLIGGRRCRMIGRVCMDQFMVDVTGMTVIEGDEVVLIGSQGRETVSVEEISALTGTISWETLAGLGSRLPRLYHRGGAVEMIQSVG